MIRPPPRSTRTQTILPYATLCRSGNIRDTFSQAIEGGTAARLDGAALAGIDGEQQVIDPRRTRMAFVRNGEIFVRDLSTGALTQLTRTDAVESRPQRGSAGPLVWRPGTDWFRSTAARGRSEERRCGEGGVRSCRARGLPNT